MSHKRKTILIQSDVLLLLVLLHFRLQDIILIVEWVRMCVTQEFLVLSFLELLIKFHQKFNPLFEKEVQSHQQLVREDGIGPLKLV